MKRKLASVFTLCFVAIGCEVGDDFGRCNNMEVASVATAEVQIFWSPAECPVYRITVDQAGSITWAVTWRQLENAIESPIIYGVVPPGAEASQARPLTLGPYRVILTRIDEHNRIYSAADSTFSKTSVVELPATR